MFMVCYHERGKRDGVIYNFLYMYGSSLESYGETKTVGCLTEGEVGGRL